MKQQKLQIVSIILGIIILAFALMLLINYFNNDDEGTQTSLTISGVILNIARSADVLTLESGNQAFDVAFDKQTAIYSDTGNSIPGSDLYQGFEVQVTGVTAGTSSYIHASRIVVERAPAIVVSAPRPGDSIISDTIKISGSARVFENTFMFEIETQEGDRILSQPIMTNAREVGTFGTFEQSIVLPTESITSRNLVFRFFEASPRDGSETHLVEIPVTLANTQTTTLRVFLLGPDNQGICTNVVASERVIPYTEGVARAALQELFAGVTDRERSDGYSSSIPSGVEIISLSIANGVADVVLSNDLERGVGGSCMVSSIRAQIERTLTQFPSINTVRIRTEGKSEGETLQP